MAVYTPRQSIGSVGAYQVSGRPYMTGSVVENGNGSGAGQQHKVTFPSVSRTLRVVNTGSAAVKLHFDSVITAPAVVADHNYIVIAPDGNHYGSGSADNYITGSYKMQPLVLDVKCKEVYVSSTGQGQSGFQIVAELTSIPATDMFELTGSGINGNI
jgi:hypothetical protein